MEVRIARKCGFCFGVEHAIELAERMLAERRKVYCLGPIIHNKQVVERLAARGLHVVGDLEEIPAGEPSPGGKEKIPAGESSAAGRERPTVLIRSHGCHPAVLEEIRRRGLQLADATCIWVKRGQQRVRELHRQGYQVVMIGDPHHPEVQGAIGYAPGVLVVADAADLDTLPHGGRLAVISQTTHSAADFTRLVNLIATRGFDEIKVVNTICRETARRQEAAAELCRQVEVMFVLGGSDSANTRELAELCRRCQVETYQLESWQSFRPQYVDGKQVAGVTAGASTPDWIIDEFVGNLRKF